jgi:hypothetical protein
MTWTVKHPFFCNNRRRPAPIRCVFSCRVLLTMRQQTGKARIFAQSFRISCSHMLRTFPSVTPAEVDRCCRKNSVLFVPGLDRRVLIGNHRPDESSVEAVYEGKCAAILVPVYFGSGFCWQEVFAVVRF